MKYCEILSVLQIYILLFLYLTSPWCLWFQWSCVSVSKHWCTSCRRHYRVTYSTGQKTGCVWVCVSVCILAWVWARVRVHSCMHLCVIYNCVSKLPMGTDSSGTEGFVWLTKDICGMSFLCEGLQLVVTPAVLSVAVPGMLHHLKKKKDNKTDH